MPRSGSRVRVPSVALLILVSARIFLLYSLLIHVVFDNNTHFYIRTIYNSGENYEDKDADFEDLKKQISVEMKGRFDNDVFHASEIRLSKFS